MRSKKGGQFERETARDFSRWWTGRERDDVFWRTSNSGGRATVRKRKGKGTYGQHGDLQATDPIGAPLCRLLSIELKRGYKDAHIGDVLDRGSHLNPRPWEQFVTQAAREADEAGVRFWLLVIRRDARQSMVFMSWDLYENLVYEGARLDRTRPWVKFKPAHKDASVSVAFGTTLRQFFSHVDPEHVRRVEKEFNGGSS